MSIATSLADDRYLFRNDKGHLYLEDPNTGGRACKNAKADVPSCSLLFGGSAISFALQEEHSLLAILHLDDQDVFLTIYEFNGEELTSPFLATERMKMPPSTKTVLWVGGKSTARSEGEKKDEKLHIAVSDTNTWTHLFFVDEAARALSRCTTRVAAAMAHNGAAPFSALHYLGVLDHINNIIYFYDVNYDKVVDSYSLFQTPEEKMKSDSTISSDRSSSSSSSPCIRCSSTASKNYIFFGHGKGSLFSAYVTKGSVRILSPELKEFVRDVATTPRAPDTVPLTEASQTDEDLQKEDENSDDHCPASDAGVSFSEEETETTITTPESTTPSAWLTFPSVVCSAVSTAQVLVAMDQLILPIHRSSSVHTETTRSDPVVIHDGPLREDDNITVAAIPTPGTSGDDTSYLKVIKYKYLKKSASLAKIMEEKISLSQLPPPFLTTSNHIPLVEAPLYEEWMEYTIVALSSKRSHAIVRRRHLANRSTSSPSAAPSVFPFAEKVVLEESFHAFPFVLDSSPSYRASEKQVAQETIGGLERQEKAANKSFAIPHQESDQVSAVAPPVFPEWEGDIRKSSRRGRRGRGRGKQATEVKTSDNTDSVAHASPLLTSAAAFISAGNISPTSINFPGSNSSALPFVIGFATGCIFMYFKYLRSAKE